jgi:hypothetical protein
MAPDERDRIFDKALARHLRAAGSSQDPANSSSRESARVGECPGPETLGAYHERSLLPEEMNSWKEHIVGCANCQTILSHLEATDEIPLHAAVEDKVLAQQESAHHVAASSQRQPAVPAILPKQSRRARILRSARWQWLAPAGALAAGLLVWIAVHEKQPLAPPNMNEIQIATKQAPPPPPPSVSRPAQETSPSLSAGRAKPQSAANEFASARPRASKGAAKTDSKQEYLAQVSPPKPLLDEEKERELRKDAGRAGSVDLLRAQEELDRDGKIAGNARQESAEVQLQTQAANAQLQNQSNTNANAPKTPGPAPLGQMEAKKMKPASAAPTVPPPQAGVAGGIASSYNDSASLQVARAIANPRLISPPGSKVVWRAGRSGLIEFSKDGGSSWSRQTSGVLVDLLTGSAPSDQVCWIVGHAGVILVTTDGAHWKVVQSPLAEDLGGVRATDALHATIWNARLTKSFQTSDGGLTWFPVPSP